MSEEKNPQFDGTLITLIDEDGKELQYEHLDSLEYEGATYLALVPVYDDPKDYVGADGELQMRWEQLLQRDAEAVQLE